MFSRNQQLIEVVRKQEAQLKSELQAPDWRVEQFLLAPLNQVSLVRDERIIPEPLEALRIREEFFSSFLRTKLALLTQSAKAECSFAIEQDKEAPAKKALYQVGSGGRREKYFWDSVVLSLTHGNITHSKEDGLQGSVHLIDYSEVLACNHPLFRKAYTQSAVPLPYAGFGISCIVETTDKMIALLKRSEITPIHPKKYSSPAGNCNPLQQLNDTITSELEQELGLVAGKHYNPSTIVALALVADRTSGSGQCETREVVSRVTINLDSRKLQELYSQVTRFYDAAELTTCSLDQALSKQDQFVHALCPGTNAGLHLLKKLRELSPRN